MRLLYLVFILTNSNTYARQIFSFRDVLEHKFPRLPTKARSFCCQGGLHIYIYSVEYLVDNLQRKEVQTHTHTNTHERTGIVRSGACSLPKHLRRKRKDNVDNDDDNAEKQTHQEHRNVYVVFNTLRTHSGASFCSRRVACTFWLVSRWVVSRGKSHPSPVLGVRVSLRARAIA